ncbi:MAG: trypsin-like peptidase domain-containing protein [Planctomycetes bacterium]|nr:trypsin-like peptidase domain-containing protein [Planctomycetota bacterium]
MTKRIIILMLIVAVSAWAFIIPSVLQCWTSPAYKSLTEKNSVDDLTAYYLNCTVRVLLSNGWGSGVWVGPNIILTAKHVVTSDMQVSGLESEVAIKLYDGRTFTARQIVLDTNDDLALIFVSFTSKYWAPLGPKPLVGQEVTMVGSPLDEICEFNMTRGYVTALIKDVPDDYDPNGFGEPSFIVDCFGAPGNSGGPVFRGKMVVGICIRGLDRSGQSMPLIADVDSLDMCLRGLL